MKKKNYIRSNYKSNLKKLPSLLIITSKDIDDNGFKINRRKICKILDISPATLNRYLHKLEGDIIEIYHRGYRTDKHTMTWKFIEGKNPDIDEILETTKLLEENYNFIETTEMIDCPKQFLLDEIERMRNTVNEWSPIKLFNNCRYIKWETGKIKKRNHIDFKGRVFNNLSLTKSGKKEYKKQDFRINRDDYLKSIELNNYGEIYDIKSEIPRLTDYLNGNHDFFEIDDYYKYFLDNVNYKDILMDRQNVKDLFMRCYFSKTLNESYKNYNFSVKNKYGGYSKENYGKLYNEIDKIGKLGNEIFLWTSLLELYVLDDIYKRIGIKLLNVYDGFYGDLRKKEELRKEIEKSIVFAAEKVKNLFKDKLNDISNNNQLNNNFNNLNNNNLNNNLSICYHNCKTDDLYNVITTETIKTDDLYINKYQKKEKSMIEKNSYGKGTPIMKKKKQKLLNWNETENDYKEWCKDILEENQWTFEEWKELIKTA